MRRLRKRLLQRGNPVGQNELRIAADKEVNVIWHNDVSTDGNVEISDSAFGKSDECCLNGIGGEPFLATVSAKGYEPNRGVYRLMDERQPRRTAGKSFHGGSSHGPAGRLAGKFIF